MATRVLVSLQPHADPARVAEELTALGAAEVQLPRPELPDVCVASIDEQQYDPTTWAARASQLPGVANAELDQLRWSQ